MLAGACGCSDGWSWCKQVWFSAQSAEAWVETVVLLLLAYCAPGGRKRKVKTTGHPLEVKGREKALTSAGFTAAICPKLLSDTTGV